MSTLSEFRSAKDEFFQHHPQSPLTAEQKRQFNGLNYFPEDDSLDLVLEVVEFDEKDEIEMQTSTGDSQRYLRYGRVRFQVNGEKAELTIYASPHGFFLPFVDSQAGKETYGAGRYLDPELEPDGRLHVDFNQAYNPYCAYNDLYSCPLTPFENRLTVPIQAGEKLPEGDWADSGWH